MAEPNPSQPQPPVKKSTRPSGGGLAGALLRIDELENIQEIHQERIQELLEQRDALQERCDDLGRQFMAVSLVTGHGDAALQKQIDALTSHLDNLYTWRAKVADQYNRVEQLFTRIEKLEGK